MSHLSSGPTCTIPVRNDLTTLDLTVQQIEHLNRLRFRLKDQ